MFINAGARLLYTSARGLYGGLCPVLHSARQRTERGRTPWDQAVGYGAARYGLSKGLTALCRVCPTTAGARV